jgi:hypothetical protein
MSIVSEFDHPKYHDPGDENAPEREMTREELVAELADANKWRGLSGCSSFEEMHAAIGMLADAQSRNAQLSDELRDLRQTVLDGEPFREAAAAYLDAGRWAGHRLDDAILTELHERDSQIQKARKVAYDWCDSAGLHVESRDSLTLVGLLRKMRNAHCDERSYADLAASGGLPEAQASRDEQEEARNKER